MNGVVGEFVIRKSIIIGPIDFKKIVDGNGYYVNKSMLIKDLSKYLSKQYESQVVLLTKLLGKSY